MKKKLLSICTMVLLTVGYSSVASADTRTVTKEEAIKIQQKREAANPVVQGERLPNTASNNGAMMALSACFVGIGTLFSMKHRNKIKA